MKLFRDINALFNAGVVLISVLVISLLGLSIRDSRIVYKEQAMISSQNLTQALDEDIKGIIDRVDLTLLSVSDEAEKEIKGGGIQQAVINAYIARQVERVPELDSLRMANAEGDILYGPGVVPGINIADRDYFSQQRNASEPAAVISKPYLSRTTRKWQISISRRLSKPDGSFAGIAYGNFTLDYFTRMFSRINVGARGAIALWNTDLELIARYPEPKTAGSEPGLKLRSPYFTAALRVSKEMGTYTSLSDVDNIERSFSYRNISKYPLYILIGMATEDYLREWRKEAIKKSALGLLFLLFSATFIWLFNRSLVDSKRAAAALLESERRYKAIVENQAEFVSRYKPGGILTFVNDTLCKYLGLTREDLLGKCYYAFIYEEDRLGFIRQIESITANHPSAIIEVRVALPDGRITWQKWTHSGIFGDTGMIIECQATGRDITDSKRVGELLRSSEARFRSIIENASTGIQVADIETREILYSNPEFCRMLGYNEEDLRTMLATDVVADDVVLGADGDFQQHAERKTHSSEMTLRRKDGSRVRMSVHSVRMEIDDKQCLVGFFSDITEKNLLEAERLKTQKLESIGTLAGGIAHDFNNLLQGIFGYISMAKLTFDQKEKSLAMLGQAEEALHVAVNLTTQLLTYASGGKPVKKLMGLMPTIENAVKFSLSGSHSNYQMDVAADLWPVEADEGQLVQVVHNVVLNANEAMAGTGTVTIHVENATIPKETITGLREGGRFVRISIHDSGIGIPEQNLSRIFDPYFTTKKKGSGLGLATSYSIIKNHGGAIEVKSELSKGTTFIIYLPAAESEEMKNETTIQASGSNRKGRILFMDDEEMMRNVGAEMIAILGHDVDVVADGEAAIETFTRAREEGRPFDIVVLDLTVKGGMGGAETLSRLLEIDPGVLAVVSSGYAEDTALANYRELGFSASLNKPYTIEALGNSLSALLK